MMQHLIDRIASHMSLERGGIRLSKFIHGTSARADSKVLFLATSDGRTIGILKMLREAKENDKLRREEAGQLWGAALGIFKTPKIYFTDVVDGQYVYFEEIVPGEPVGQTEAATFIPSVLAYQVHIPKENEIAAKTLAELLPRWERGPDEYARLKDALAGDEGAFWLGPSHGDVTHMNLLSGRDGAYLIDWERYGERPLWGIDFAHYIARCVGANGEAAFDSYLDAHQSVPKHDKRYYCRMHIADRLLDMLQKDRPDDYMRSTLALRALLPK